MNNDFNIGITTFSLRYGFVEKLVNQIRSFTNRNIIISVNGEYGGNFNEEYRKKILLLCTQFENIFPIFFIETRGLAKMWNSLVSISSNENILLLNDDMEIISNDIFYQLDQHVNTSSFNGLTTVNGSFSSFLVNRELLNELKFFDERLLGFGEEDGDITFRYINLKKRNLDNLSISGVLNVSTNLRHEHVRSGIRKYSAQNREFTFGQKYITDPSAYIQGMFDSPMIQVIPDINAMPYEKYFWDNKNSL